MAFRQGDLSRFERQLKLMLLLHQADRCLTVEELAAELGVSKRTVYRDLNALESTHLVPITGVRGRKIAEGHFLPPIRFAIPEVITIFLAARLMLAYSRRCDPNIVTAFSKLNSVVRPPLRDQIQKTMEWLEKQPVEEGYLRTMATLAEAWAQHRTVRMRYHALGDHEVTERCVDPYYIEPAAAGHSSYVIGHCHLAGEMRMFKMERIKDIDITDADYQVPADFDANAYLSSAWGVVAAGEAEDVTLRFAPEVARIMEETRWHPSQQVQRQADGSALVTLRVANTIELQSWVMGWGEKVEVLEPESLRQEIINTAGAMLDKYETPSPAPSNRRRRRV